jgi:hypothetical protein
MTLFGSHRLIHLLLAGVAGTLLCPAAFADIYGNLYAPSLSCTRASLAFGDAVLPACIENKASELDSVTYYVSVWCVTCDNAETIISITPLHLNVGLQNGPCPNPVGWNFSGAIYQPGPYIGGTLSAQSTKAFARITSSNDCNGVTTDTGPNGSRLPC